MSGDGIAWATAHYRLGDPGVMHVTGDDVDEWPGIPVGLGEKPTTRALSETRWQAAPGQQWREWDGTWTVRVYPRDH